MFMVCQTSNGSEAGGDLISMFSTALSKPDEQRASTRSITQRPGHTLMCLPSADSLLCIFISPEYFMILHCILYD